MPSPPSRYQPLRRMNSLQPLLRPFVAKCRPVFFAWDGPSGFRPVRVAPVTLVWMAHGSR